MIPRDLLTCKRQIFGCRIGADVAVLAPKPILPDVEGNKVIGFLMIHSLSFGPNAPHDSDAQRHNAAFSTSI